MEGKTIETVEEGRSYSEAMPHLDPESDAETIRKSPWLSVVDDKVYASHHADHLITFTDGTQAIITSCGCCGGAEFREI